MEEGLASLRRNEMRNQQLAMGCGPYSCIRSHYQLPLLHAGAATTDILTQYVSTIKALQQIDPSGKQGSPVQRMTPLCRRGGSSIGVNCYLPAVRHALTLWVTIELLHTVEVTLLWSVL